PNVSSTCPAPTTTTPFPKPSSRTSSNSWPIILNARLGWFPNSCLGYHRPAQSARRGAASRFGREPMIRQSLVLLVAITLVQAASAQGGNWQFQFKKGQVLNYQVEHNTVVAEVVEANKVQTQSKLKVTKRWQVEDVDAKGVATLHLSLASMRQE